MAEPIVLYAVMTDNFQVMKICKSFLTAKKYATKRRYPVIGRMFEYARIDAVWHKPETESLLTSYSVKKQLECWELQILKNILNIQLLKSRDWVSELFKHKE